MGNCQSSVNLSTLEQTLIHNQKLNVIKFNATICNGDTSGSCSYLNIITDWLYTELNQQIRGRRIDNVTKCETQ